MLNYIALGFFGLLAVLALVSLIASLLPLRGTKPGRPFMRLKWALYDVTPGWYIFTVLLILFIYWISGDTESDGLKYALILLGAAFMLTYIRKLFSLRRTRRKAKRKSLLTPLPRTPLLKNELTLVPETAELSPMETDSPAVPSEI
jgi:hypothetical protein